MSDRAELVGRLSPGDIFHANSPATGASLICLALSVSDAHVHAKTVTTQVHFDFDRTTGIAISREMRNRCTIDSVAPLPSDVHEVMLEIDKKFTHGPDFDFDANLEKMKLTEREIKAFVFVSEFYPANPI